MLDPTRLSLYFASNLLPDLRLRNLPELETQLTNAQPNEIEAILRNYPGTLPPTAQRLLNLFNS